MAQWATALVVENQEVMELVETVATIFNIQRYSIHDGPGIRTTVFLKGCPLKCLWCANPESQKMNQQVITNVSKCINCGACVEVCPTGAAFIKDGQVYFDIEKCSNCEKCIDVCPTNAKEVIGKQMTIDEVINEIEKDASFYNNSNGGVTFSGGEPTVYYKFLGEIVPRLKEKGIHVAIETTGFCAWHNFWTAVKDMDLILFDLKQMDLKRHEKFIGVSNKVILQNAEKIAKLKKTIFRLPVIPGYNDELENFEKIADLLNNMGFEGEVNLLPYHSYGKGKYEKIGMKYELEDLVTPTDAEMAERVNILRNKGIHASV